MITPELRAKFGSFFEETDDTTLLAIHYVLAHEPVPHPIALIRDLHQRGSDAEVTATLCELLLDELRARQGERVRRAITWVKEQS